MGYSPQGRKESDTTERFHFTSLHFTSFHFSILAHFCLESSMDRGAWQATVHGIAKSRTQLSG